MAEVHDCFTPTELVLMEDLGFAERGTGWKDVLAGTFDLDGELPVNPDGGLKSLRPPDRRLRACACCSSAGCSCAARRGERQIASVGRRPQARPSPTTSAARRASACRFVGVVGSEPSA